jgi:hypothetical protein
VPVCAYMCGHKLHLCASTRVGMICLYVYVCVIMIGIYAWAWSPMLARTSENGHTYNHIFSWAWLCLCEWSWLRLCVHTRVGIITLVCIYIYAWVWSRICIQARALLRLCSYIRCSFMRVGMIAPLWACTCGHDRDYKHTPVGNKHYHRVRFMKKYSYQQIVNR